MILLLKTILIICFGLILYQDVKERQVHWFLFPIVGILCGLLYYIESFPEMFFISILMNFMFIGVLTLGLLLYAKIKMGTSIFKTIGLGDILLFIGLSVSFATVSFIVMFIGALIFSLILHLFIKRMKNITTIPLAGYMSLFFALAYMSYWTGIINNLYVI